ncbi:MAG: hypothetical protein HYY06_03730 [Deltaproteobacteria bacterium]|nr:hypothetical protein [Deltaproteobacteria bacterium]
MAGRLALVAALGIAASCSDPTPTALTLPGAFERVASAIDAADAKRLYWDLDLEARWSLMSIHRSQKRARRLVNGAYPPEERERATGRWTVGAEARTPGELFAILCARDDCMEPLRAKIGAAARIERTADGGVVHTIRGGTYRFTKGADGRYGLVGFADRLAALKLEVARDLEVIERTALSYRGSKGR